LDHCPRQYSCGCESDTDAPEAGDLADLPWQSVYIRLAGYEDLNDAERLAADPTFRLS
jgi:hypothetical protein